MSYQVIARKYRPQRFGDVVGQEHVTQTLTNAIRQGRIAHAYLFCGPRGTGKTTIARIFAKCLNCVDGPRLEFADDDPRCQEIADGRALDVIEIDGASNRGIDEIRELRDTVRYAPAISRFKIYIIDEVHMLTKEAFNALLKTLEEPPAHVKFMFATTEPEKVLPTILSRCQRFDLRRIPAALIVMHLTRIAEQEKVRIGPAALHAIARGAEGGMRDAESTLDQLISFCGEQIEEPDVLSMFGLVAQSQIVALAGAMLQGELEAGLRLLDELARHGKDLGRLLADLLGHFRNVLIYQVSRGNRSLLELSEVEAEAVASQSTAVSPDVVSRIMEVLADHEWRLRDASSKRILLEVALLKAIEARKTVPLDAVLAKLRELRDQAEPVAPASAAGRAPRRALVSEASPPSPEPGGLTELWAKILEGVGRASPFARSYLLEAQPVSFQGQVLTIGYDPEFADHLELVDNAKNRTLIQTKLKELGCGDAQVKFVRVEAAAPRRAPSPLPVSEDKGSEAAIASKPAASSSPSAPAPEPPSKNDFKNDPLIRKALEIFKGQVVDVRNV
jgi:DNA polymerase-3 subunit gamma/tau